MRARPASLLLACLLLICASVACLGAEAFRLVEDKGQFLTVFEGSKPVVRYVMGEILPEGVPEDRRRSSYIHPLYSLDGVPLTDDFPKDHYHHRGLSWMWPKVRFAGVTKDLWTLKGIRQKYIEHHWRATDTLGILNVTNGWYEDSTGRKILDEEVSIRTARAGPDGRLIAFWLTLSAVDVPVTVGVSPTGYGGLNLRFAPRKDTIITTSKGPIAKDQNRARYAWADLSGRFADSDRFDGVAIVDMPDNPHYPSGWTLRFYGDLNPAFTSTSEDYVIEPGKPLKLIYDIYVHRGKADPGKLDKLRSYL